MPIKLWVLDSDAKRDTEAISVQDVEPAKPETKPVPVSSANRSSRKPVDVKAQPLKSPIVAKPDIAAESPAIGSGYGVERDFSFIGDIQYGQSALPVVVDDKATAVLDDGKVRSLRAVMCEMYRAHSARLV